MNKGTIIFWGSLILWALLISWGTAELCKGCDSNKSGQWSTPVERRNHDDIVVIVDSILDTRFGPGCCEEDIDTVNANTFNSRFGGNLLPME